MKNDARPALGKDKGAEHSHTSSNFYRQVRPLCVKTVTVLLLMFLMRCSESPTAQETNSAPGTPVLLTPDNGATDLDTSFLLVWYCTDPDGDAVQYTVRIFDNSGSTWNSLTTSETRITITGLAYASEYTWQIIASDSKAASQSSEFSFATKAKNRKPNAPTSGSPDHRITDAGTDTAVVLTWSCTDPDGDALSYTIEIQRPSGYGWAQYTTLQSTQTSANLFGLDWDTYYRWRVIASDGTDTTSSEWWNVLTQIKPIPKDQVLGTWLVTFPKSPTILVRFNIIDISASGAVSGTYAQNDEPTFDLLGTSSHDESTNKFNWTVPDSGYNCGCDGDPYSQGLCQGLFGKKPIHARFSGTITTDPLELSGTRYESFNQGITWETCVAKFVGVKQ